MVRRASPTCSKQAIRDLRAAGYTHDEAFEALRRTYSGSMSSLRRLFQAAGWGRRSGNASVFVDGVKEPKQRSNPAERIREFRRTFDKSFIYPERIQEKIDTVLLEKVWMFDSDFREACDISLTHWRKYAAEFDKNTLKVDGKIIWVHPKYIGEIRERARG